jgi:hypothetical protein
MGIVDALIDGLRKFFANDFCHRCLLLFLCYKYT